MCGIVGYVGRTRDAVTVLLEGLRRLEYRGYDSAGIAVQRDGELGMCKVVGRVEGLTGMSAGLRGATTGIAHTRWATHGPATAANAHPHTDASGRFALVHNGIIENVNELRERLAKRGVTFASQTDSEVLAHLVAEAATHHLTLTEAVREALRGVEGTYGLLVLDSAEPDVLVAARNGSPLVLGLGDGEMFVASDVSAIVHHTSQLIYLEDGELATVRATGYNRRPRHGTGCGRTVQRHRRVRPRPVRGLHGQGDQRAAGRGVPGAARQARRADRHRAPGRSTSGTEGAVGHPPGQVPRLRLRLLRGPVGRRHRGKPRPHPRRRRTRRRVPLPGTRSSTRTACTSRSASPAKPSTPWPRYANYAARAHS